MDVISYQDESMMVYITAHNIDAVEIYDGGSATIYAGSREYIITQDNWPWVQEQLNRIQKNPNPPSSGSVSIPDPDNTDSSSTES